MQKLDDKFFLKKAFEAAWNLSQDMNTQTGAVLVTPGGMLFSHGANRMHHGIPERYEKGNIKKILVGRPEKYDLLVHAERDVIYSAVREGKNSLILNSTLYATWSPCKECSITVINSGVKRFVTHQCTTDWYNEKREATSRKLWDESIETAISLLKKCGVEYICLNEPLKGIKILFDDKIQEI